jgi:hypothetical protein
VTRLVDVMPTVLELTGAPAVDGDGRSLVAMMTRDAQALDLGAYAETLSPARFGWSPLRSLRVGRFKLIDAPRPELYDLSIDPGEQRNLHAELPSVGAAISRRLSALTRQHPPWRDAAATFTPTPETMAQLAALGYLAGARPALTERGGVLPDPKDRIDEYNQLVERQRAASGSR